MRGGGGIVICMGYFCHRASNVVCPITNNTSMDGISRPSRWLLYREPVRACYEAYCLISERVKAKLVDYSLGKRRKTLFLRGSPLFGAALSFAINCTAMIDIRHNQSGHAHGKEVLHKEGLKPAACGVHNVPLFKLAN